MRSKGISVCAAALFLLLLGFMWPASLEPELPAELRSVPSDASAASGEIRGVKSPHNVRAAVRGSVAPSLKTFPVLPQPNPPRSYSNSALPTVFEPNAGQAPPNVTYIGRGRGAEYFLKPDGVEIDSRASGRVEAVTLSFLRASSAAIPDADDSLQAGGPRKRKRSSSGRTRKPRQNRRGTARRRSSHPPGAREERPRDVPRPSAYEKEAPPEYPVASLDWQGESPLASQTNYFLGRAPSSWHTHVANFSAVRAAGVVPGVDVVLYGGASGAEYDLRIAPHADPWSVRLELSSPHSHWRLYANGDLVAPLDAGEFRMKKPVAYQLVRRSAGRPPGSRSIAATNSMPTAPSASSSKAAIPTPLS